MRTIIDTAPAGLRVLLVVGGVLGTVNLSALAVRRFVPATREGFDAEVSSQLLVLQFPFSDGLAVDQRPFREGALAPLLEGSK